MLSIIKKQGPTQDSSDEKQKEDDERATNGHDAYGRQQNVGQSKNNVMASFFLPLPHGESNLELQGENLVS